MYKVHNLFDYLSLYTTNVFYNCNMLNKITFSSKKDISINITNNISFLGESVFENCEKINNVYYDPSINYVSKNLFKNCTRLHYIVLSNNLNIIRESSFENCVQLKNILMPKELELLESFCFKNCSLLDTVQCYEKINLIKTSSFENCISFQIPNYSLLLHNNNNYVKEYFKYFFPLVKIYKLSYASILKKYINNTRILLNTNEIKTKQYTYPSIDVILTGFQNIIDIDNLINQNINEDKIEQFRFFSLKFIFDSNLLQYNNFIIKTKSLLLTVPCSNEITYIQVYNECSKNINVTSNLISNLNIIGAYCLVNSNLNIGVLNDYKIQFYKQNNNYNISYSNDNYITSSSRNISINENFILSNYTFIGSLFSNLIIYRSIQINAIYICLDTLQINICNDLHCVENNQHVTVNAYSTLDVPLSIVKNTFLYRTNLLNPDYNAENDIKFKVVNYEGWTNIYLTQALVKDGYIPYKDNSLSLLSRKEIKYDFIKYLALCIFKTSSGAGLFKNNHDVSNSLDINSNVEVRTKLSELEYLGEFFNKDEPNNISRTIFRQILTNQPERITQTYDSWQQIPLYVGDKIYLKLIINPNINQSNILSNYTNSTINKRSYIVELNLISG